MLKAFLVKFVWLLAIVLVPFSTLWDLLFHQGLYSYADQHFPLSTTLEPIKIISYSVSDRFSFDRLIVTWPYYLISFFVDDMGWRIRAFLLYTFLLYSFLCYLFAYISVEFYSKNISKLSYKSKQLLKLPIYVVSYSNLAALQLNADGGTWAGSLELILLAASVFLILDDNSQLRRYLMISGLMILMFLLNPDFVPMLLITMLVVSLTSGLAKRNLKKSLTYFFASISFALLPLLFLYHQGTFTSPLKGSGIDALHYRPYTLPSVSTLGHNIDMYDVFILLGQFWSTLTFSPPSILWYKSQIPFLPTLHRPPEVLLPPDPITSIWLCTLVVLPAIAFSSLCFKSTRKIALQIVPVSIIAYTIAEQKNLQFVYYAVKSLTKIPLVGNAIGTAFSVSGHFIDFLGFSYLPLFSLGIISMFCSLNKTSSKARDKNQKVLAHSGSAEPSLTFSRKSIVAIVIVTLLLVLAGWQAFNGSMYPMRANPDFYLVGNGVAPKGVFSPTKVDAAVLAAYELVTRDYSHHDLNYKYNVLWIGGPYIAGFTYAYPRLGISMEGLESLVENKLYADVDAYLVSHGVRYVVVSNQNIQPNTSNPFARFGFTNYSDAVSFFEKAGLKTVFSENQTKVFLTSEDVNLYYRANLLLNVSPNIYSSALYSLFEILGYNVTLSDAGIPTGFNDDSSQINIVTPAQIPLSGITDDEPEEMGYNVSVGHYVSFNSSMFPGELNYSQSHSKGQYNKFLPGGLTTTVWSGDTKFSYDNGLVTAWSQNASISIDYNGPLAASAGGVMVLNSTSPIEVTLSFLVRATQNFTGDSSVTILGESKDLSSTTYYQKYPFDVADNWTMVSVGATLPPGTTYVDFRINFKNFSGMVSVKNIAFRLYSPKSDTHTPFGSYYDASGKAFHVPAGFQSEYIVLSNNSTSSPHYVFIEKEKQTNITGKVLAVLLIKKATLDALTNNYFVVNDVVTNSYALEGYQGDYYLGVDGSYIFPVAKNSQIQIRYNYTYAGLLIALYVLNILVLLILTMVPLYKELGGKAKFVSLVLGAPSPPQP